MVLNVLRAQVDRQGPACRSRGMEAHAPGVEILDHGRHAVHKVIGLVYVASEENALAFKDLRAAGLKRALSQLPLRLEVRFVGIVVHGNRAQGILVAVVEEDLRCQAIHERAGAPGAGDDGGVGVLAQQLQEIPRSGLGRLPSASAAKDVLQLLHAGHSCTKASLCCRRGSLHRICS